MSKDKVLPYISRNDPEKDFELLKQIGSGTYGEVYKVCTYICMYAFLFVYCM